jgi:hypothetical protein
MAPHYQVNRLFDERRRWSWDAGSGKIKELSQKTTTNNKHYDIVITLLGENS